jgi:hypothetical protein
MHGCLAEAYQQKVVHRCNQGRLKYLMPDSHFHAWEKWVQMNQYHHLPLCQQENSTQHKGCDGGHHLNPQHVCLHVHAPQHNVRVTQLCLCTIYVYQLLEIPEQS